jgi:hypothetical protein
LPGGRWKRSKIKFMFGVIYTGCPKIGVQTMYLLLYRGCLNVHEKIWKKCFRQKNQLFLLLLTVIQSKQRYIRTSLRCNVAVVDLK